MTDTLPEPIRLAIEAEKLANAYAACWPVDTQVKADTILGCAAALRSTHAEAEALRARVADLEAMLKKANSQAEHFEREWYLLGDALESLQSKLAEAGKDAARYRWLRSVPNAFKAQRIVNDTPEGMDAAIDAAIAAKEQ